MRRLGVLVLFAGVVTSGCAMGNRYAYHTVVANPQVSGTAAAAVATHDQREYVLSGNKPPQFVGLQRGGYGNPFDVKTEDDKPLADAMSTAIVNTLTKKGFRAQPVVVAHSATAADARQRIIGVGADRAVLLTLKEWKSDTAMRVGLLYNVTLAVLDRSGTVLAEKRLEGNENLGAAPLPGKVGEVVAKAFTVKLEELFDDPAIAAALRGGS
jgi:hypothetical protein